jgi:hypothetical protein
MRVCLLLSGIVRNFEDTYPSIQHHLIDRFNDIDVFIYGVENDMGQKDNEYKLKKLYNPKKIVINLSSFYDGIDGNMLTIKSNTKIVDNSLRALFNVKMANELKKEYEKENNFKYDVVIRSRFDLFWVRPICEYEMEKVRMGTILVPYDWAFRSNHPSGGPNNFGFSDLYSVSNSENMDFYSNIFEMLISFPYEYHSESIIGYYLKDKKVFETTRHITIDYPTHLNPIGQFGYASTYLNEDEKKFIGLLDYEFYSPKVWEFALDRKRFDP